MTPPRVLIVERDGALSSRVGGAFGRDLLRCDRPVSVSGMLEAVRAEEPSLVMVEVDSVGTEVGKAIEAVMAECPVPMLLMALGPAQRQAAMKLLASGALDVMQVPLIIDPAFLHSLKRQLMLLARVSVVRHPKGRRRRSVAPVPVEKPTFFVVAIATSLGGPKALATLLAQMPRGLGAAMVICQHITPGFSDDLAKWLELETGLAVREAVEGATLEKGQVIIAPSHLHLVVLPGGVLHLEDGPAVGGFKPSCDVLLKSVAAAYGPRAIGVVLTGMGRDGAKGLQEIRNRGGHTIAQDENSCVVFGMPREAIELGAAEKVMPLGRIGRQLLEWVS